MNKELPSIYVNKIDGKIDNSQEIFYENRSNIEENISLKDKINGIFSSPNFIYKKNVKIVTDDGTLFKSIVGISNGYLLTMDNDKIDINKIKDIK